MVHMDKYDFGLFIKGWPPIKRREGLFLVKAKLLPLLVMRRVWYVLVTCFLSKEKGRFVLSLSMFRKR